LSSTILSRRLSLAVSSGDVCGDRLRTFKAAHEATSNAFTKVIHDFPSAAAQPRVHFCEFLRRGHSGFLQCCRPAPCPFLRIPSQWSFKMSPVLQPSSVSIFANSFAVVIQDVSSAAAQLRVRLSRSEFGYYDSAFVFGAKGMRGLRSLNLRNHTEMTWRFPKASAICFAEVFKMSPVLQPSSVSIILDRIWTSRQCFHFCCQRRAWFFGA